MDTKQATASPEARRRALIKIAVSALIALVVMTAGFVAVAKATDQPAFCGSACHEMAPFHQAWASGAHKGILCIDCHVDANPAAQLQHKFVALQEVADHIKGPPTFPLATAPAVPDSRCLRCHHTVTVKQAGFSHADHAKRGPCVKCHADVGHNVTTASLRQAGIFRVAYKHAIDPTQTAPGVRKADIVGHVSVGCSKCHAMAAMQCKTCHTPGPNHQNRPTVCTVCHQPGVKFVFTHPQRADCNTCHSPPSTATPAHTWTGECTQCHLSVPGVDWKFTHPINNACGSCHTPSSAAKPAHVWSGTCTDCHRAGPGKSFAFTHPARIDCETCHARPAKHRPGSCTTCHHSAGSSWVFAHPAASANCESCHARPAPHNAATCTTCHKSVGSSWAFSHPDGSASCRSCHNAPAKHRTGSCSTCHKNTGKSWSFSHPVTSSGCTSCHTPPASHFGTRCISCHTPGTTWANVHFSHPPIPGGQHTYTTFACARCHPSAPPAHYCTCHGSATGPGGG